MSRGKKSESDENAIESIIFEPKFLDKLCLKLESVIISSVERCLDKQNVIDKLVQSVEKCFESKFAVIATKISALENENIRANERIGDLILTNKGLSDDVALLKKRVEMMEAHSKKDNLIIHGLKVRSYAEAASSSGRASHDGSGTRHDESGSDAGDEVVPNHMDTQQAVIDFCRKELHVDVTERDISAAHRLKPPRGGRPGRGSSDGSPAQPQPTPVIVRFTSRRVRDVVFTARKKLKKSSCRVFINEHLTPEAASLFKCSRDLVKGKKIASTWTFGGQVYIRLSDDPLSRPKLVSTLQDLPSG